MIKGFTFYLSLLLFIFSSINVFSQAPLIIKEPHSHGVIEGQTATFSVTATGDTLTYQWYLNDNPIGGATDSIYTTPAANLSHNGEQFYVIVSNNYGEDTSNTVTLYVTATNKRVTAGQIVLYNFNERTGNKIKDASGIADPLDLTITNTSSTDWSNSGLYVKNNASINSTSTATHKLVDSVRANGEMSVELWIKPVAINSSRIIDLSTSKTNVDFGIESLPAKNGYNFVFRSTNTDDKGIPGVVDNLGLSENLINLTFTWSNEGVSMIYRNGIKVASDTIGGTPYNWVYQTRLSLGSFLDGSQPWEGIYYLTAIYDRSLDSAEINHNFSLGLSGTNNPFIIKQPQNKQLLEGSYTTFSVNVISDSPVLYQWQKDGVNISGATESSYQTPQVTLADSGSVFRVIATNSSGSDTSDGAILQVTIPNPDCPQGITHYYPLNESSPPYRDFVGFSDGTSSSPPDLIKGVIDSAQNFSNQAKINISSDVTFNWRSDDSFSIEFWMKTNSSPSNTNVIVGRYDNSSLLSWWVGINTNSNIIFSLRNVVGEEASIGDNTGPAVNDGNWHLIAALHDGISNKLYLYIDGNKIDSASQTFNDGFNANTSVNLGYLNVSPFYYYNGVIDEVAFYNAALLQSTIQYHYYKGLKGYAYCEMIPLIPAPTNLQAIKDDVDTTNVKLSWDDNSSNELGFIIQRKMGDSASIAAYTNIDTVGVNVVSYTDSTTSDTTKYTYRLYAYNTDTVSTFSNIATITTPLPVELTSFTANVVNGKVMISWETATEINNAGFRLERSEDNNQFSEVAFIKGKGTSTEKSFYSYTDKSALSGKYYYRLKQIDFDGTFKYLKSTEVDMGIPSSYSLEQNFPNPFNPSTTIRFALPMNSKVSIKLYNSLGQEVAYILNSSLDAGIHEKVINASNLSSGVYFYRLEAQGVDGSNFVSTKRMILMK